MTIEDTRQLGIEFERRVQVMIPEKEYAEKLDSQTIYSFLNQYQDKYIHDIYRSLDKIQQGSKLSSHVESILQALLREKTVVATDANTNYSITDSNNTVVSTGRSVVYPLDSTFYMYIRSVSRVKSSFSFKSNQSTDPDKNIRIIPNEFVSQSDVWRLLETPHNTLRILRYPAAVLTPYNQNYNGNPTLTVIYDQYTDPVAITVTYYAQPRHFDIMSGISCELPVDAFEELVSGAVDLYVQYVAGAEANRKRIYEAQRQQAAQQNKKDNNSEQ